MLTNLQPLLSLDWGLSLLSELNFGREPDKLQAAVNN